MQITPLILEKIIQAANDIIEQNKEEVAELDRVIGDGDHVINFPVLNYGYVSVKC
jgi:dihydroxyacetone kinase